jgi:hypothetical protein
MKSRATASSASRRYHSLVTSVPRSIPNHESAVHLSSVVIRVCRRRGLVEVEYQSTLDARRTEVRRCTLKVCATGRHSTAIVTPAGL